MARAPALGAGGRGFESRVPEIAKNTCNGDELCYSRIYCVMATKIIVLFLNYYIPIQSCQRYT